MANPAATFNKKWKAQASTYKKPSKEIQAMIAERVKLDAEKPKLPPLALIAVALKEMSGYGIMHTSPTTLRGAGLFYYYPTAGEERFAFRITTVEWKETAIPKLTSLNMRMKLEFINGWFKVHVPTWGWVGILPAQLETQKLLLLPREENCYLVGRISSAERGIVIQFGQS